MQRPKKKETIKGSFFECIIRLTHKKPVRYVVQKHFLQEDVLVQQCSLFQNQGKNKVFIQLILKKDALVRKNRKENHFVQVGETLFLHYNGKLFSQREVPKDFLNNLLQIDFFSHKKISILLDKNPLFDSGALLFNKNIKQKFISVDSAYHFVNYLDEKIGEWALQTIIIYNDVGKPPKNLCRVWGLYGKKKKVMTVGLTFKMGRNLFRKSCSILVSSQVGRLADAEKKFVVNYVKQGLKYLV